MAATSEEEVTRAQPSAYVLNTARPFERVASIAAGTGISVSLTDPTTPIVASTGVTQVIGGSGIGVSPVGGTGVVTLTSTGPTQIVAGTGIGITPAAGTGVVTVSSTGVTQVIAGTGIGVTPAGGTGAVTLSSTGVTQVVGGAGIAVTPAGGTGVVTVRTSGASTKIGFMLSIVSAIYAPSVPIKVNPVPTFYGFWRTETFDVTNGIWTVSTTGTWAFSICFRANPVLSDFYVTRNGTAMLGITNPTTTASGSNALNFTSNLSLTAGDTISIIVAPTSSAVGISSTIASAGVIPCSWWSAVLW